MNLARAYALSDKPRCNRSPQGAGATSAVTTAGRKPLSPHHLASRRSSIFPPSPHAQATRRPRMTDRHHRSHQSCPADAAITKSTRRSCKGEAPHCPPGIAGRRKKALSRAQTAARRPAPAPNATGRSTPFSMPPEAALAAADAPTAARRRSACGEAGSGPGESGPARPSPAPSQAADATSGVLTAARRRSRPGEAGSGREDPGSAASPP
jgi:hypothetical protein